MNSYQLISFNNEYPIDLKATLEQGQGCYTITFKWKGKLKELVDCDTPTFNNQIAQRRDLLWNDTCFEFFLRGDTSEYFEGNINLSGQWNLFHFDSLRSGKKEALLNKEPSFELKLHTIDNGELTLKFEIPMNLSIKQFNLTSIISENKMYYFAIKHPNKSPDFHDPKGFEKIRS